MKRKIWLISAAFTISFIMVSVLAYQAIRQFGAMVHYSNQIDRAQYSLERLNQLESLIKDIDRYERGFMITGDSGYYAQQLQATNDSIAGKLLQLKELLASDESDRNALTWIRSTLQLRGYYLRENLLFLDTASHLNNGEVSPGFVMGRKMTNEVLGLIEQMRAREFTALTNRFTYRKSYQSSTGNNLKYLFIGFAVLTIVLFFILINEVLRRLRYQDELQLKLIDLKRSHGELEQIAFAASHDLQEPLRKIRVFSDRLMWMQRDQLTKVQADTFDRISASANQMQDLIEDLANFTSLARESDEPLVSISLNHTLEEVKDELFEKISAQEAIVSIGTLPEIRGHAKQLHILFKSLLDNSLKFIHNERKPRINVYGEEVSGEDLADISPRLRDKRFLLIVVTDNGIGFENKFASKIFRLFQRLHSRESGYGGKGIGLAICQRIMLNHQGYILAQGRPQQGATFKLFFPLEA